MSMAPGSLVGRRVMAWYEWVDTDPPRAEWLRATVVMSVVKYRRRVQSEFKYLLHCDVDGADFAWDGEMDSDGPDGVSSVQLLSESVERCMCPRCMLASPTGVLLAHCGAD